MRVRDFWVMWLWVGLCAFKTICSCHFVQEEITCLFVVYFVDFLFLFRSSVSVGEQVPAQQNQPVAGETRSVLLGWTETATLIVCGAPTQWFTTDFSHFFRIIHLFSLLVKRYRLSGVYILTVSVLGNFSRCRRCRGWIPRHLSCHSVPSSEQLR